jgi:hypothetical protein
MELSCGKLPLSLAFLYAPKLSGPSIVLVDVIGPITITSGK